MMDPDLVDQFTDQVDERGSKIKRSLAAALKLWITLPEDIQARLLSRSLDADFFIELVHEIVDERIAKGYADGKKFLAKRQKSKRTRRG